MGDELMPKKTSGFLFYPLSLSLFSLPLGPAENLTMAARVCAHVCECACVHLGLSPFWGLGLRQSSTVTVRVPGAFTAAGLNICMIQHSSIRTSYCLLSYFEVLSTAMPSGFWVATKASSHKACSEKAVRLYARWAQFIWLVRPAIGGTSGPMWHSPQARVNWGGDAWTSCRYSIAP